jgi:hypothetical protein
MDTSSLGSFAIPIVATLAIYAIRMPASKLEERTKRLQYWKTFFDVASLVDTDIEDETKKLCRKELAQADDETRNLSDEFMGFVATVFTLMLICLILSVIARVTILLDGSIKLPAEAHNSLGVASLIFQTLATCVCWFWARWKIRDYVWNELKPGNPFHFVIYLNPRLKALVSLVLLFLLMFWTWFVTVVVWSFDLNKWISGYPRN